jgi:NADH-quinone oxidoreductase subunit N
MSVEILFGSPLISIFIVCILSIVLDAMTHNKKLVFNFGLLGLLVTGGFSVYTLLLGDYGLSSIDSATSLSRDALTFGGYAAYLDVLFCVGALLVFLASKSYIQKEYVETSEYYHLVLFALSGMMIIAHSRHLLTLFVGIEIMSITFYIMAGYFRKSSFSVEASLKYFLLGSFSTGFLLYGMAMIYGATGSMDLNAITTSITSLKANITYLNVGYALMIVGLSFKVAAFPFHQWAPDVYTGSPTVVTAYMSTAGKAAALIAFIIVSKAILPNVTDATLGLSIEKAKFAIGIIAAATMLIGNLTALVQKNVKRMLAYSSVAHAGYLLMGIVSGYVVGWKGILFYSTAYLFMQIGAFLVLSVMEKTSEKQLMLSDFTGLWKSNPVLSFMMAVFMFSLAGLPPFAGFFGKYLLFSAAIKSGFTWLTLVGVVSSVISMYFYIGLIIYMFFKEPEAENNEVFKCGLTALPLWICTIAVVVLGIFPFLLDNLFSTFF